MLADRGKEVVEEDEQDCVDEAGALAAAPRGDTQRNAHQHQHETGCRKRNAGVQLNEEALGVGATNALEQCIHGQGVDGGIHPAQVHFALRVQLERTIGGCERGDVVLVGIVIDSVVLGSVAETHEQHLGGIADHGGGRCGSDARRSGVADLGHEDLVPVGRACSGTHVLHVENEVLEFLVEDAGLNLVGGLRCFQRPFHVEDGLVGAGGEIERVGKTQQRACDGHDGRDAHKVANAQARGAHGDDLAVRSKAAEPEQNADQHGHRNGYAEEIGQREEKDLRRAGKGGTVANHHLQNVGQVGHEQNEGEERAANERVGEDFTEDVAGQDAHKRALKSV